LLFYLFSAVPMGFFVRGLGVWAAAAVGVSAFLPSGHALAVHGIPKLPVTATPGTAFEGGGGGDLSAAWPVAEEVCESKECPHYEDAGEGDGYALRYYVGGSASLVAWLRSPGLDGRMAMGFGLQQVVAYASGLNSEGRPVDMGAPLTLVVMPPKGGRGPPEGEDEALEWGGHPDQTFMVIAPVAYAEETPAPSVTAAQFNMKMIQAADNKGTCVAVAKRQGAMDPEQGKAAFMELAESLKKGGISAEDVHWKTPFVMAYGGEGDDAVLELGFPLAASVCGKEEQGGEGQSTESPLLLGLDLDDVPEM